MAAEGGATWVLCLAASSGLPLFCRPPRPQLPFPVLGALHGVHVFGAAAGAGLRAAATPTTSLAWGGYGQSITLIALSSAPGASVPALCRLLDSAFGAMVLVLGLDELVSIRNVERLKRDLRSCFRLIDWLLLPGGAGLGAPSRPLPPGPPRDALQERLGLFARAGQTGLGCLLGGAGHVLLATPPWWGLPPPDAALLGGLLAPPPYRRPPPVARDLPVYLPHSSPTVPLRLLLLELLPGVGVGLLCGPRPPLQHLLTQLVPQFWGPVLEQLRGCARPAPPPLPPEVLAYLLIHQGQGWTQSSVVTGGAQEGGLPPQRRGAALQQLYTLLGPQCCPQEGGAGPAPGGAGLSLCYAALGAHTGCALLRPPRLLLLLLPPRSPRARMRDLALRALRALAGPGSP